MKDPLPAKSLFSRLAFPALKICRALSLFIPAGLLFLAAGRAAAQDPYRDADAAGPAQGVQAVSHTVYEDGLAFYEFSNGLSLFVLPAETDAATVRAYVRNTGSAHEGALLGSGISHLTEHIVCGGSTSRRSEEETRSILERLGGRFNAATGSELTSYYIDCSSETVPAALDLLAGWMTDCAVDPDEFAREKQVIAQELADAENDPQQVAAEQVLRTVYREHPLRHPAGGYPDVFRTLSPEAVKDFYKTHYTPNNTIFFVAGRVRPEEVLRELAEQYREIPRAPEIEPVPYSEPVQIAPRETVIEMPGETYQLRLAWPTAARTESTSVVSKVPVPTGFLLPFSSGSPSSMISTLRPLTLPSVPRISTGALRKQNFTPSSFASAISSLSAGISSSLRRYTAARS